MKPHDRRCSTLLAAALFLAAASTPAYAVDESEAVLLSGEAGATVPIEGQTSLRIAGLAGKILLRTGKPGELRYEARAREDRRAERPVGLWLVSRTLELGPLPEAPAEPLWIEMAIPPGLAVDLDLDGAAIEVAGLRSDVVVRGGKFELDARGIYGRVFVEAAESKVKIDGVEGDVQVDGETLQLLLRNISSGVVVALSGGQVDVSDVRGRVDLDLSNATLVGKKLEQGVVLHAVAGPVELQEVRREAELRLSDSPITLSKCDARIVIDSDGQVRFDEVRGIVTVTGVGAGVEGRAGGGALEISTSGAAVALEQHDGSVRVEGDGLTVQLRDVKGDVTVETTSSEIQLAGVAGAVAVTNDFGDVHLDGATAAVRITNLDGSVFASRIGGLLDVHGRGDRVEVAWSALGSQGQHTIVNETGDVVARLPPGSKCRVEVESSAGQVSSELPTVLVTDDGRFASGVLGQAQQPLVQIRSAGDVLVTGASGQPAPTQ